jgi:hypothetical protein
MKQNSFGPIWLWVSFAVLVVTGLGFTFYYGIQPRPAQKIKLSKFESPGIAANAMKLRLREEIKAAPVMFWGLDATHVHSIEILKSFLTAPKDSGVTYDHVIWDSALGVPPADLGLEVFDFAQEPQRFVSGVQGALAQKMRILAVTSIWNSSQTFPMSFASQVREKSNIQSLSMTFLDFPRTRSAESNLQIPCKVGNADDTGSGKLGCLVLMKARSLYRKKFNPGEWVGLLDQVGLTDYVFLMTRQPET